MKIIELVDIVGKQTLFKVEKDGSDLCKKLKLEPHEKVTIIFPAGTQGVTIEFIKGLLKELKPYYRNEDTLLENIRFDIKTDDIIKYRFFKQDIDDALRRLYKC